MPKKESKTTINSSSSDIARKYLTDNPSDHYNFEDDIELKISTGSLIFDCLLGGGVPNGCIRATGGSGNGKTSFVLNVTRSFLKRKNARAIYARSEGRLSEAIRVRSGITFVTNPDDWVDGTCLILDSNIYEFVFGFFKELITNNPEKKLYYFIVDSADSLVKRDDLDKPFEQAHQSPGGAMLTSVFFKKVGLAMAKRGHTMVFISQKRDTVRIDPRQKVPEKQGGASGANSLKHQAMWVFEFLDRKEYDDDFIRQVPSDKKSKIIGHWCKVRVVKSDNETNETIIKYPIQYGKSRGNSVWVSLEVADMLIAWEMVKKGEKGWMTLDEELRSEIKQIDENVPEKIQGIGNLREYLETNPKILDHLYSKFTSVLE